MFFCEKCHYTFNITKNVKSKQIGGKINNAVNSLLEKFNRGEKIENEDISNLKADDIINSDIYDAMTIKNKKSLISQIRSLNKGFFNEKEETIDSPAFFICKFCKNSRPIVPGTMIFSKTYVESSENDDLQFMRYDNTLARTKTYICINQNCETQKDPNLKEAVLTKKPDGQLTYICTVCNTDWIFTL